jgi:hypothetical protein
MSAKYKFRDHDQLYFISFSVVYWIDLFIRIEYNEIMPPLPQGFLEAAASVPLVAPHDW